MHDHYMVACRFIILRYSYGRRYSVTGANNCSGTFLIMPVVRCYSLQCDNGLTILSSYTHTHTHTHTLENNFNCG